VSAMAKLVYSAITSLDGYTADETGDFGWAAPDPEVFEFINDQERGFGTSLYGRRMYETMVYWENFEGPDDDPIELAFAEIWRAQSKVVYSKTLEKASSAKTVIERTFDPASVQRMKQSSERDVSIAGANLAGQAIEAGLVDEVHLFVTPATVGGGKKALSVNVQINLELLEVNRFQGGVVHLRYRIEV
jgi:dihydrofolate reductase